MFVLMVSVLMVDGVCPPAGVLVVSQLCFGGRWRLGGTLGGVSVSLDGVR